mmetsp:Transcript_41045/g.64862  ORF Transcript_41045/g.64862 Transcript_41045/m.64862 type:complete len:248 (+) Transcript_41045:1065-1808(+)
MRLDDSSKERFQNTVPDLAIAFQAGAKELIFNVDEMLGILDQVAIRLVRGGLRLGACTPAAHRTYHLCTGLLPRSFLRGPLGPLFLAAFTWQQQHLFVADGNLSSQHGQWEVVVYRVDEPGMVPPFYAMASHVPRGATQQLTGNVLPRQSGLVHSLQQIFLQASLRHIFDTRVVIILAQPGGSCGVADAMLPVVIATDAQIQATHDGQLLVNDHHLLMMSPQQVAIEAAAVSHHKNVWMLQLCFCIL